MAKARRSIGHEILGVSVRTLQECEQGRRAPSGAARTLLLIAQKSPAESNCGGSSEAGVARSEAHRIFDRALTRRALPRRFLAPAREEAG